MVNRHYPASARFRQLKKQLKLLEKQFLPPLAPFGRLYTDRQFTHILAYRVFAHAEIEAYLENRVQEVVRWTAQQWKQEEKASIPLLGLLAFSGQTLDLPPAALQPKLGSSKVPDKKLKLKAKIETVIQGFHGVIENNHGIKEKNLLALLLPIGIVSDDLDPGWLTEMENFGSLRGDIAHTSAIARTQQPPNPVDALTQVQQLLAGLEQLDRQISSLMQ